MPGAQISGEDMALVFSTGNGNAIAVSDPDAGASPLEVTLTANQGTLTLAGTAGLTFIVGGRHRRRHDDVQRHAGRNQRGTRRHELLPPLNYSGPASVTITTNDMGATGAGGPHSDTDTVDVTVKWSNDAPTLDLDANDSSGAVGANYVRTFTEGLGSVRITDVDADARRHRQPEPRLAHCHDHQFSRRRERGADRQHRRHRHHRDLRRSECSP